jgi:hypothetical protein
MVCDGLPLMMQDCGNCGCFTVTPGWLILWIMLPQLLVLVGLLEGAGTSRVAVAFQVVGDVDII